jgi:DNA-binding transcriptional ArsR family regulator
MVTAQPQTTISQSDDARICRICKALSNPVRMQILRYVLQNPDCIGNMILLHLPDDAPHAQSTLSQHLRVLRDAGLLEAEGDGPAICYRVNQESFAWLREQLTTLEA